MERICSDPFHNIARLNNNLSLSVQKQILLADILRQCIKGQRDYIAAPFAASVSSTLPNY